MNKLFKCRTWRVSHFWCFSHLSPSLVVQQLGVEGREVYLVRRLEEHRVHQVLVLLPTVQVGLGGEGGAAGQVPQDVLHREVLQ